MMGADETALGVDVGGTRIRVARADRAGRVIDKISEPVRRDRDGFARQLLRLVAEMRERGTVGIGIGIPGRVDGARGAIWSAGYLDIAGLNLPVLCAEATGLAARVENDATMALIAEAGHRRNGEKGVIAMMTVGTGIGGAILKDGAPWHGGGFAGQLGHIVVAEDGPPCNCGRTGCVETLSSGTALGNIVAHTGLDRTLSAEDLFVRAAEGDEIAANILETWSSPFQRALESLVAVVDPRLVVIGGGLGAAMVQALAERPRHDKWFGLPVEAALLGDDAGVVGAALIGFAAHDEAVAAS